MKPKKTPVNLYREIEDSIPYIIDTPWDSLDVYSQTTKLQECILETLKERLFDKLEIQLGFSLYQSFEYLNESK